MGIYRWEKAEEKDLTGRRREVRKSLADGTINSFLLRSRHLPYPLRKIYPYFEEESSQVPHLKKVHDQIDWKNSQWANSPSHDAHDRRERAQNGVSILDEAHVRKESFSRLSPLC
jgi:hypothetical protein